MEKQETPDERANRQWRESRERASKEWGGCLACLTPDGPGHIGSMSCRSGSLASGGNRSHCTCDTCF